MNNFDFILTDDNSVGLYDNNVKDIYHSKTGALKEAFDKFICPAKIVAFNKRLKILDICYGIGYNTKLALNYNDNCDIDCLEYNSNLAMLSPFINDSISNDELKLFVLGSILKYFDINEIEFCLTNSIDNSSIQFFNKNLVDFISFLLNSGYKSNPQLLNNSFLHNIYYNYISNKSKNGFNVNKYDNSTLNFYFDDARKSLKLLNKVYDVVFLDAFSPQKDPTLWTIDFLSLLKSKMNTNSILVSYSKSTPFRSALLELGFYVGKTFIDDVDMGTVASFNEKNILYPLDDFDKKLMSTRSGITYKDTNLDLLPNEILSLRENEQKISNRISHTAFLKQYPK